MYILNDLYIGYNIINIIIFLIGLFYIYANCFNSNIVFTKSGNIEKLAIIVTAVGTAVIANNNETDRQVKAERDEALKVSKEFKEEVAKMKQELYEEERKKEDAWIKIESQKAEIEELKEENDRLKSLSYNSSGSGNTESSETSPDSSGSGNTESSETSPDSSGSGNIESSETSLDSSGSGNLRSPNEDSFISSIYHYTMEKIKIIDNLELLQIYAGCNLILLLVLVSCINTCLIYVLNSYFIHKYDIVNKYPSIYKYIKGYRIISYYSVLINISLIIIIIIALIFLSILYIL